MSHWHISKEQARKARLAKAFGPKAERSVTSVQVKGGKRAAHGPGLQPIDRQVEQVKGNIARVERSYDKARAKGRSEQASKLLDLLHRQQGRLSYLLAALADAPGFHPGTTFKPKATDHTSYHPKGTGTKPKASAPRRVRLSSEDKARAVAALEREAESTARQQVLGRPKGTKA